MQIDFGESIGNVVILGDLLDNGDLLSFEGVAKPCESWSKMAFVAFVQRRNSRIKTEGVDSETDWECVVILKDVDEAVALVQRSIGCVCCCQYFCTGRRKRDSRLSEAVPQKSVEDLVV